MVRGFNGAEYRNRCYQPPVRRKFVHHEGFTKGYLYERNLPLSYVVYRATRCHYGDLHRLPAGCIMVAQPDDKIILLKMIMEELKWQILSTGNTSSPITKKKL